VKFSKILSNIFLMAIILLICSCSNGEYNPTAKYTLAQLQADYNQLRNLIDSKHPFTFTDRSELGKAFDKQYELLRDNMTSLEFYRVIAPAVSKVQCGHTRLSFPDSYYEYLRDSGNFLPFDIRIFDNSLYIYKNYTDKSILIPGTIVVKINGEHAHDIIAKMRDGLYTDGENVTYKDYNINLSFKGKYLTLIDDPKEFELEVMPVHTGEDEIVYVPAKSSNEIRAFSKEHNLDDTHGPLIETNISDDNRYAVLRIRFFDFYDDLNSFAQPVDSFFQEISEKNIKSLILDLRGNDGGDPYSAAYLSCYLIGNPFRYYSQNSAPFYNDLKSNQTIPDYPFKGNLYTLIDGGCYSTTGHLISQLKYHKIGTFIGIESGGSYICNGGYKEVTLDNTGINLLLPHVPFATAVSGIEKGIGIMPGYIVPATIEDLINNEDSVLDSVISLINTKQ